MLNAEKKLIPILLFVTLSRSALATWNSDGWRKSDYEKIWHDVHACRFILPYSASFKMTHSSAIS